MTDAKVNFNFEESLLGVKQVKVQNTLGRKVAHLEFVWLGGYFGEVREFDGIDKGATATPLVGASGLINIDYNREVRTNQIKDDDDFELGGIVYFVPGGDSAAGLLRAGYVKHGVAVGICTFINEGVAIGFRPFAQQIGGGYALNVSEYTVDSALTLPHVITGLIPVGAQIVDVRVKCTASVTSGTLQLKSNATTPANITDAIICAVDKAVTRAGTLENDVVTEDGLQIAGHAATNRGVMTIYWR